MISHWTGASSGLNVQSHNSFFCFSGNDGYSLIIGKLRE